MNYPKCGNDDNCTATGNRPIAHSEEIRIGGFFYNVHPNVIKHISYLEGLLKQIEEHPHQYTLEDCENHKNITKSHQYALGVFEGHLCAAEIAKKWRQR